MTAKSVPSSDFFESLDVNQQTMEIVDRTIDSNDLLNSFSDLFIPLVLIAVIFGSLFVYYLWKLKKSK